MKTGPAETTAGASGSRSAAEGEAPPPGSSVPPVPEAVGPPGTSRYSVATFLCVLLLMFLLSPFLEALPAGDFVETVLMTIVLGSAVLAVGGRRGSLAMAIILVTPALAGKWLNHLRPDLIPEAVSAAAGMAFLAFVVVNLFRFILHAPRVDSDVLCAAISAYLLLGLLWALAYILVGSLSPDAFRFTTGPPESRSMEGFNAFYFSFVTLSTIGFGDIAPVSNVARMLVVMEAITGLFYMAILIARLVSMQPLRRSAERSSG
jgi:ion channel